MHAKEPLPERSLHRLKPAVYANASLAFHFTLCARHQDKPFLNSSLAEKIIESLLWTKERYSWRLFCFCLMPDHLHFLCRLSETEEKLVNAGARGILPEGVLDHVARFKSFTTQESWKLNFRGKLWQKQSYDRVFDLDWPFEQVAQYILDNPVRRGLAKQWDEWPYSRIVDPWW